ncbi:alpha/beta hydrolase [uncultured Endozoicomonas sp.]|uniref:alpha/beta hydrolase n=1 Tax=uncultured Endozoicomonas sp. TaxID=432652 RepID=UPI002603B035|nr:alpha/beta hydrolase [uncultured Endozoicomonas sp.]
MSYPKPEFLLPSTNNEHTIPVYCWKTDQSSKGVIHISHGMGEHSARYDKLAKQLNAIGFNVLAHDHRGHGAAIENNHATAGEFGANGWKHVILDTKQMVEYIEEHYPGQPLFLLGHSMGSYILQGYLNRYNPKVQGVILSGSNFVPTPLLMLARLVAKFEVWRQGGVGHSAIINQLTFAGFNRQFKPNKTEFDWLSRNPESVQQYVDDPLCGFRCSNQLWSDVFDGLYEICSTTTLEKIDKNLPVLIIGGDKDPVSAPNGLKQLHKAWLDSGHQESQLKLYKDARHELFNETNKQEVFDDLMAWLQQRV